MQPSEPKTDASTQTASGGASQVHWYSAAQFALSTLAILGLWTGAAGLAAVGFLSRFQSGAGVNDALQLLLMAVSMAASGLLLIPSAILGFLRMVGRQAPQPERIPWVLRPTILILLLPLVLLAGYWVSIHETLNWWLLPPIHVIAIGLPVLWLLYLGSRRLPAGSLQRIWGVFGSGLVLGPTLILLSELFAMLAFGFVLLVPLSTQPDLQQQLNTLLQRLQTAPPSPSSMNQLVAPLLTRPIVILSVLTFIAVIVPLIEEALKPIGVWLLAGSSLTPVEGFTAGLLSGAGYALFESLVLSSGSQDWVFLVTVRIGTAVIHILTTGLTGWALAVAWREKRYLTLGVTYLASVLIHGLWNGMTLMMTFSSFAELQDLQQALPLVTRLGSIAPIALGFLTLAAFTVLLLSNRALRRSERAIIAA
jgi:hypothetical protein